MQCDSSKYVLFVRVPAKLDGSVDRKAHSGEDAATLLELLLSAGCSASVRPATKGASGRRAFWEGDGFAFYNFLLNTNEVAGGVRVRVPEIVNCVKAGILDAYSTPNGFFHLVVKNKKLAALTHMRAIAAKIPMKRSVKGKGLSKLVMALASECRGFPVGDFEIKDVRSALEVEADWRSGREYEENSLALVMLKLEKKGKIVRIVDAPRDMSSRRWSFVGKQAAVKPAAPVVSAPVAAAPVTPSSQTVGTHIDQIARQFAGEIVERARSMAKEMLGL